MRKGKVFYKNEFAGFIIETDEEYVFSYDRDYLNKENSKPVSLTLPLKEEAYKSNILFPFFDGLIPEGWLLNIGIKNWKLNPLDRFGLLLTLCEDCIGCVSVKSEENG